MSRLFIRARAPKSKEKPRSTSRLITRAVPAVSIAVTLYLWVRTFSPAPVGLLHWNGGEPYICPRVTVCAEDWVALGLLGATRTLAYLCYPLLMLLFLGKANNLVCALSRSVVGVYVPFHRLHELHASAGASRFWGACNDPDAALARCLKAERLQKRADNYALARKRGAVTLAKAKAKDDEASG